MKQNCVVGGCANVESNPGVTFFVFPQEKHFRNLARKWHRFVKETREWPLTVEQAIARAVICSDHFKEECFNPETIFMFKMGLSKVRLRLVQGAIPTLHKCVVKQRHRQGQDLKESASFHPDSTSMSSVSQPKNTSPNQVDTSFQLHRKSMDDVSDETSNLTVYAGKEFKRFEAARQHVGVRSVQMIRILLDIYEAAKDCDKCSSLINERRELKIIEQHEDILLGNGMTRESEQNESLIVPLECNTELLREQNVCCQPESFENVNLQLECESETMPQISLKGSAEETVPQTLVENHCKNKTNDCSVSNICAPYEVRVDHQSDVEIGSAKHTPPGNTVINDANNATLSMDCLDLTDPQINCVSTQALSGSEYGEFPDNSEGENDNDNESDGIAFVDNMKDDPDFKPTWKRSKPGTSQEMGTEEELSESESGCEQPKWKHVGRRKHKYCKSKASDSYVLNDGKNSLVLVRYKPYIGVIFEDEKRSDEMKDASETLEPALVSEDDRKTCKYYCKVCGYVCRTLVWIKTHIRHREINASIICQLCGEKFSKPGMNLHRKGKCGKNLGKQGRRRKSKRTYPKKSVGTIRDGLHFSLNDGKNSMCNIKYEPYIGVIIDGNEVNNPAEGIGRTSETVGLSANNDVKKTVKYYCKVCRYISCSLHCIKQHVLRKELAESVLCQACGRSFSKLGIMVHRAKDGCLRPKMVKRYDCSFENCKFSSPGSNSLKRHISTIHNNRRSHVCTWEGCGKRFNTPHALTVHTRTHTGEKPIVCYLCGYRCKQKASLNWHMKSKHPGQPIM